MLYEYLRKCVRDCRIKKATRRMSHGFLIHGGEDGIRTHVRLLANWFRVSPVMTTSIPLRIYLNTILSPAAEKPAQKKLRIWGEFVGRTTKIFNYIIPQKPATYKGFRAGGYRIATLISSQGRYNHFDTTPYLSQHDFISRGWKNSSEKTENLGRIRGEND